MSNYTKILELNKLDQIFTNNAVYVRVPLYKDVSMYYSGGKIIYVNTGLGANIAVVQSNDLMHVDKNKK